MIIAVPYRRVHYMMPQSWGWTLRIKHDYPRVFETTSTVTPPGWVGRSRVLNRKFRQLTPIDPHAAADRCAEHRFAFICDIFG